jgi:hypothetical protein
MATEPGMKVNTKVYTSIEEVVSDYTNNDNFNTLIFYNGMISIPIKLVSSGGTHSLKFFEENPLYSIKTSSTRSYIKRNFLLKTSTITPIMEKWSNLGLNYGEEIRKIVDFIKGGNYFWIANVFEGFGRADTNFIVESLSREHLEDLVSLMNSIEKDTLSLFFEKAFTIAWEDYIKHKIRDKNTESLDFDVGEEKDSFAVAAMEIEDFLRDPKNLPTYPITVADGEELLALFSGIGKEETGKLHYGKIWDFVKTRFSPQGNRESLKFIEEEKEKYDKMGVLSLFPEIFYFKTEGKGDWYLTEFLSIVQSKPETKEAGLVLLGHGEVSDRYKDFQAFFLPFVATKSRTALKLFTKSLEYGFYNNPIVFRSINYNPVTLVYESESSKKEKPKFQIFSFSYGPMIEIKSPEDEKEKYLYAPMVEHVFYSQRGKGSIGARRVFVEDPEKLSIYNKNVEDMNFSEETRYREIRETHEKLTSLINIPSLSRPYTRQEVEVDLTERNKIVEMIYFVEEMLERDKRGLEKRGSKIALRDPDTVIGEDEIEKRINKDLCYFGEGERVYIKGISEGFTKDEKNILRMGTALIGNLSIETSEIENTFIEKVKNLYEVILVTLKRFLPEKGGEGARKNFGKLLEFIKHVSEMSEEVGKAHRITVERDGEKEIFSKIEDPRIKLIRNSEKMTDFGIARMAKEVLPELAKRLEESNGPNITVVIDYIPRVELHLLPEDCVDEDGEKYDLETLIEEGCDPKKLGINSVLEKAVIFLDFKEEGLRVASINLSRF